MAGKPKQNMVPHLSKCTWVDPSVRTFAEAEKTANVTERSAVPQHLSCSSSWSRSTSESPIYPLVSCSQQSMGTEAKWTRGCSVPTGMRGSGLSLSPLPSPLLLSIPLYPEPVSKHKRMSSTFGDLPLSAKAPWTPALQMEFGEDMCKLLIAIHAPWNAANNPQMRMFIQKWVPGAVVPDR